ncbi:MAG: DotA/TraY family protein [Inquilinus sp.]|uniref:DotA/TraY family protein n=1 Tax=Inquilinus sp. TaxID=1932117 RepID=UPI003F36E271
MADASAQDMFTPAQGPYGTGILDALSGGAASRMFFGTSTQADSILGTIFGVLNLGVLIFAAIVGVLTFLQMSANSAISGEPGGRTTNPNLTLGRTALGLLALIPLPGGLNLIQLIVIFIAATGTGFADYGWRQISALVAGEGSYIAKPTGLTIGDQSMVNNLSAVLAARVAGKVCMQDLNGIARALALPTPALAERPSYGSNASGWTTAEWAILDSSAVFKPYAQVTDYGAYSEASQRAVFNKSASLCGSVKLFVNSGQDDSSADTSNEAFNNAAKSLGKRLDAVAVSVVMAAAREAVDQVIEPAADDIARIIVTDVKANGLPGTDADILALTQSAPLRAAQRFVERVERGLASAGQQTEITSSMTAQAARDGWLFAANWQRLGATIRTKMTELRGSVGMDMPALPRRARDIFGAELQGNKILDDLVRRSDAHVQRIALLGPAWSPPLIPAKSNMTPLDGVGPSQNETAILGNLWRELIGKLDDNREADPMVKYQETGQTLFTGLGVVAALDGVVSVISGVIGKATGGVVTGVGDSVSGFLGTLMEIMGYGGVALVVVVPLLPMLYYLGAIIGWLIHVIETLFALPVVLLGLFSPARGEEWAGSLLPALLMMFMLLFRPLMILGGLIAAMAGLRVLAPVVDAIFQSAFALANPNGSWLGVIIFGVLAVAYCAACFVLVLLSCKLIGHLTTIIGRLWGALAGTGDELSDHVVANVNPINQMGGGLRGSMGQGSQAIASPARGLGTAIRSWRGKAPVT